MSQYRLGVSGAIVLVMGLGYLANAGWMLLAPNHWYLRLPAEVPDFGPFNIHFVRDIGCAFFTAGVSLVWGCFSPRYRIPLWAMGAVFSGAHALLHVYDMLRGAVDSEHWLLDLPGIYGPTLLLVIFTVMHARKEGEVSHAT